MAIQLTEPWIFKRRQFGLPAISVLTMEIILDFHNDMPKVFEWKGHRFHFFSNEGYPLEPIHIHVRKGPNRAKFWINPCVSLEYNHGFSSKELNEFRKVIEDNIQLIEEKWNEHFNI